MPVSKHAIRRLKERYQKEYSEEELEELVSLCRSAVHLKAGGKKKQLSVIFQGDLIKVIFDPNKYSVITVLPLDDLNLR